MKLDGTSVTHFYYSDPANSSYQGWYDVTYKAATSTSNEFLVIRKKIKEMVWNYPAGTYYYGSDAAANQKWYDDFKVKYGFSTKVISPNGGESWQVGSTQQVKWQTTTTGKVRIDLLPSGAELVNIAREIDTSSTAGSYSWTIPATITPGSLYKVRITCEPNPTGLALTACSDMSDSAFTIIVPASTTSLNPQTVQALAEFSQKKNLNLASILAAIAQLIEAFK